MRNKFFTLFLVVFLCISAVACSETAVRPIDRPNTVWKCESDGITFSVSDNGTVTNASAVGANGESLEISIKFGATGDDKMTITSPDGSETYAVGRCEYSKDSFNFFVEEMQASKISIYSMRLVFNLV